MEIWRPVIGYEGLYEISNYGNVKSLPKIIGRPPKSHISTTRIMKGNINKRGYVKVDLKKDGYSKCVSVHRLVLQVFTPNTFNKPDVNHIDGNKQNNRAENLEWCTVIENIHHAMAHGLRFKGNPRRQIRCVVCGNAFAEKNYQGGKTCGPSCLGVLRRKLTLEFHKDGIYAHNQIEDGRIA